MHELSLTPEQITARRAILRQTLTEESENIKDGTIDVIDTADLWLLLRLYDKMFFLDYFRENFKGRLTFALSRQMTNAAGITKAPKGMERIPPEKVEIEIKISLNFLFDYHKVARPKSASGLETRDALDALLFVFEHELCHFYEFVRYHRSGCGQKQFKELASALFGHTDSHHRLPSRREILSERYGLHPGARVAFEYNGKTLRGIVSAVRTRAAVMVENRNGRYADRDGRRYAKYMVPVELLTKE